MLNPVSSFSSGSRRMVREVAVSLDGERVITASDDRTVRVWTPDGSLLSSLKQNRFPIKFLMVSAEGRFVASVGTKRGKDMRYSELVLWDTTRADAISVEDFGCFPFGRPLFIPGSDTVAVMRRDVSYIDVSTAAEKAKRSQMNDDGELLAVSPDGKLLVFGHIDGPVLLWDREEQGIVAALQGHTAAADAAAFSLDGEHLATASEDGTVRIWEPSRRKEVRCAPAPCREVFHFGFLRSHNGWVMLSRDRGVQVFGMDANNDRMANLPLRRTAMSMTVCPKQELLLVGATTGDMSVYSLEQVLAA